MTTGYQVFQRVMRLLNYVDAYGGVDSTRNAEVLKRALAAINQIYAELWFQERGATAAFTPLASLQETVQLSERVRHNVLPYGVAMLLAQGENDGDSQALYAALYNAKRMAVSGSGEQRQDVMPRGSDL